MSKKVSHKLFNNSWYNPGGNALKRVVWYFINLLFIKNPYIPITWQKVFWLRLFGAKIGKRSSIKPGVSIKYPWRLKMGDDVWIGENVWIDNLGNVDIQSNVCISQGAMLLTGNHNYKKPSFDLIVGDITLEEGAWVGAQSVVCPGVTCHSHSILAVNSVATSDLEAYQIYQGNPAIKVRTRKIE